MGVTRQRFLAAAPGRSYRGRMPVDRSSIRVKAMLLALDDGRTAHAVSLNPPTSEHPVGYHRLIGDT